MKEGREREMKGRDEPSGKRVVEGDESDPREEDTSCMLTNTHTHTCSEVKTHTCISN